MVHRADENGIVHLDRNHWRSGIWVSNHHISKNVTIDPKGQPQITLLPHMNLSIPDSLEITITGEDAHSKFLVLEYLAGEEF